MSCNALGSIFSRFCDSFSCVFGTLCNCSQNHVLIVGDVNSSAAQELVNMSQDHPDLNEAVKALGNRPRSDAKPVKMKSVSPSKQKDQQEINRKAAVLYVAQSSLQLIAHREMSGEEKMVRLTVAAALAGIRSLNDCYKQSASMSSKDLRSMKQKVSLVQNYGSSAAFLWKHLKEENCRNAESLKGLANRKKILAGQVSVLSKLFVDRREPSFLRRESFGAVDTKVQAIFLRAAQIFPKKEIARQGFVSWMEESKRSPDVSSSSDHMEQASSSHQEVRQLILDLGVTKGREADLENDCPVGVKRVELLCYLNGLEGVSLNDLNHEQILILRKNIHRLQELDGTIVHIFACLKVTLDPVLLKKNHFFTEEITQKIKKEMKKNTNFGPELKSAENLLKLTVPSLNVLYEIADQFSSSLIGQFSSQYLLSGWLSNVDAKSPALHLTAARQASVSRDVSLRMDREAAERMMDEERARASQNTRSRNSPERKVTE